MAVRYINYGNGSSTGYFAVTTWATGTAKTVGQFVRQLAAPTVGNERCFVCIVAGTTGASTEPTWVITPGAKTTDNTVTWMECTGLAGTCGDLTNTAGWVLGAVTLGTLIHGVSNATTSLFISTTAGTISGAEPTWNTTTGANTTSGTSVWTCLGLASGYAAFQNPHARLGTTIAIRAAGDVQYVADNHAETQSTALTMSFSLPPNITLCVDHTVVPPTSSSLKTTATITTTGASALTVNGNNYIYGITFSAGTGTGLGNIVVQNVGAETVFEACNFILGGTNVGSLIIIGAVALTQCGVTRWNNCSVQFANASQSLSPRFGQLIWRNSTAILPGGTLPNNLSVQAGLGSLTASGVDFSAITGNIVGGANSGGFISLTNCLINASANISGTLATSNARVYAQQIDSGSNLPRHEFYWLSGVQTTEEVVVRSGGASDGTTPVSWKIVTNANGDWSRPFAGYPIIVFSNRVNASITATIEIVNDGLTLTNQDVWIEVEFFGSSSSTLTTLVSDGLANGLTTPASQTTSFAAWTTTGLTTPIKQNLSVTFTPLAAGMLRATVKVGRPSATIWVDPKITIS